jgi:hypothetical protein
MASDTILIEVAERIRQRSRDNLATWWRTKEHLDREMHDGDYETLGILCDPRGNFFFRHRAFRIGIEYCPGDDRHWRVTVRDERGTILHRDMAMFALRSGLIEILADLVYEGAT